MNAPQPADDAQRSLEQRALRNVRDLIEKMEGIDRIDRRSQKRALIGITVGALVGAGALVAAVALVSNRESTTPIVIDAAKTAPAKPDPTRR